MFDYLSSYLCRKVKASELGAAEGVGRMLLARRQPHRLFGRNYEALLLDFDSQDTGTGIDQLIPIVLVTGKVAFWRQLTGSDEDRPL